MLRGMTVVVTGGAGFIGSHLADRLIDAGRRVICIDSMRTGARDNLSNLLREPRFDLIEQDVLAPPPEAIKPDQIYQLACPASPRSIAST